MAVSRQALIDISAITSCDSGLYQIGEIDFKLRVEDLEHYLKKYGTKGKEELLLSFSFLAHRMHQLVERMEKNGQIPTKYKKQ